MQVWARQGGLCQELAKGRQLDCGEHILRKAWAVHGANHVQLTGMQLWPCCTAGVAELG
jgi:hypothetical protein